MLDHLSLPQVEKALAWLASPLNDPPPEGLEKLHHLEWYLLERMLERLLQEKSEHPLQ
jgi:hypothetical protein